MGIVKAYTDGGSRGNPGISGCGCVIKTENTRILYNSFLGTCTNNEAEYYAVIVALEKIIEEDIKCDTIHFFADSMLVVKQLSGSWKIKEPRMQALAQEAKSLLEKLEADASFFHIPREKNKKADSLANAAMDGELIDNKEDMLACHE